LYRGTYWEREGRIYIAVITDLHVLSPSEYEKMVSGIPYIYWSPACVCVRACVRAPERLNGLRKGADKFLAFPVSYFPIWSTTKIIFLGWVKEVRTTKP
jgi:hypothetical protein